MTLYTSFVSGANQVAKINSERLTDITTSRINGGGGRKSGEMQNYDRKIVSFKRYEQTK